MNRLLLGVAAAVLLIAPTAAAAPADVAYALSGATLLSFDPAEPAATTARAITGLNAGETLAGIDIRPQNGFLYGLGIDATANTGTLYAIAPQTGVAGALGRRGSIALKSSGGGSVDLPDPATTGYGFDFDPAADRVRVVAGRLNFRIDPSLGVAVDTDANGVNGVNPDGRASTPIDAAAYANSRPNVVDTTLYTLNAARNALQIQTNQNAGTQAPVSPVTVGGVPIDFSAISGFDADPTGPAAGGTGYAALAVDGRSRLYRIDLTTAVATLVGEIGNGAARVQGLALTRSDADGGTPLLGLDPAGPSFVRFLSASPGTATTAPVNGVTAGERLVGVSWRPQTGQLLAVGINAATDRGTLYLADPQTGAVTPVVGSGSLGWTTADGATLELPDPATTPYSIDVDPAVDRIRIVAATGFSARIDPNTGGPVDAEPSTPGSDQADATIAGAVTGVAYTNDFGQPLTMPSGPTTLYDLEPATDRLLIQTPPDAGTLTEGKRLVLDAAGAPAVDVSDASLDIPGDVAVAGDGAVAGGEALAVLTVGGRQGLYALDLAGGRLYPAGALGAPVSELTSGLATGRRPHTPCTCPAPTASPVASVTATATTTATATPATAAVPASTARLKKAGRPKRVGKRLDTGYTLSCPAGATSGCSVEVTLKAGGRRLVGTRIVVPTNATKRLKATLPKRARARLRRRTVKTRLTLAVAGGQTKTVTVTLRKRPTRG